MEARAQTEEERSRREEVETHNSRLQEEVRELSVKLEQSKNRIKQLWKVNCSQLTEFELILAEHEEEIATLKRRLSPKGDGTVPPLDGLTTSPPHVTSIVPVSLTVPTTTTPGSTVTPASITTPTTAVHSVLSSMTVTAPTVTLTSVLPSASVSTPVLSVSPSASVSTPVTSVLPSARVSIPVLPSVTATSMTTPSASLSTAQSVTSTNTSVSSAVAQSTSNVRPGAASRARQGKAPPIEPFTGDNEVVRLDDWIPTLQRASRWNDWSEEDLLLQLAGYLRGRAAQEWDLIGESDKCEFTKAVSALRSRRSKTLFAQEFRHTLQKEQEGVSDYIRRLERAFRVAYGRENISCEVHETLLHGQLHEGLRYDIMKAPAVSGATSYTTLCVAAKNEERRLTELRRRHQYSKPLTKPPVKQHDRDKASDNKQLK